MFNIIKRHLSRVHNVRELDHLDPRLRADIGLSSPAERRQSRPLLLLPLGPAERCHA